MTEGGNRREAPRILTDFSLVLTGADGSSLDDRALAHDVSDKGFKAETQAPLAQDQIVRFKLALGGEDLVGRARIVWIQKTDMAVWAGAQFVDLSWADRRRIRKITSPSDVDWGAIGDRAITALSLVLGTVLAWTALTNPVWRDVLPGLFPKALAAIVAGLALIELLRPRR